MFELNTLKIIIVVGLILFALCLVAIVVLCKKLKAGKIALEQGWEKYNAGQSKINEYDWFPLNLTIDLFSNKLKDGRQKLENGYLQLQNGEKLYKKFVRIRFWLVIFCAIIAVVYLALIGLVFWRDEFML